MKTPVSCDFYLDCAPERGNSLQNAGVLESVWNVPVRRDGGEGALDKE
jgi:hypothetical protein